MRWIVPVLFASAAAVAPAARQAPVFRAGVDLVRVDVAVTDHGAPVRGLSADNFVVTDNGVRESVTSVTVEALPLRVVLVLDTSSSVEGPALAALVDASRALIAGLRPGDRIAVVTFSADVTLVTGFDADRGAAETAVSRVQAGGATAVYDALQVAFALVRDDPASTARPLIVVSSDGFDTASWLGGDELLAAGRRADVVVHAIEPPDTQATFGSKRLLNTIAKLSGGRVWPAQSHRDLKALFAATLAEMRDRYLLAFSPETPARPGWHDLKVSLRNARGDVLARPGYYVDRAGR